MNDDELSRLLSDAFDAKARHDIGAASTPPAPRFAAEPAPASGRRRLARLAAPLTAAAAVIAVVALILGITSSDGSGRDTAAAHSGATGAAQSNATTPVHIKLLNSDDTTYGVGMPVIAYFSKRITDARPLERVTTVSVDGKPQRGAWYFEDSQAHQGYPVEAHLRLENYWPAHAKIHVGLPVSGVSAGKGLTYDDSLTLDFATGPRNVFTVDDATHTLTASSDGHTVGRYPVSLGSARTPTQQGVKVIMEKGRSICLTGPGYHQCGVKYTQRLTYAGEYLHAAPWNKKNIAAGVNSSNGCTNLTLAAAKKLYAISEIGDVVEYPNATGSPMHLGQGYGDWNVTWSQWQTGGLVPTH